MKNLLLVAVVATWTAHWNEPASCPQHRTVDPYTGQEKVSNVQLAVACFSTHKKEMTKTFESIEDALKFKEGCKPDSFPLFSSTDAQCSDWKIYEEKE